jgi:hypothetical protein
MKISNFFSKVCAFWLIRNVCSYWPIWLAILISTALFCYYPDQDINTKVSFITKLFYFINKDNLFEIIGGVFVFAWGVIWKIREENRVEKELFEKFNDRYDKYNDVFNLLRKETSPNDIYKNENLDEETSKNNHLKLNITSSERVENLIIDYFNLCAEEYLWYKRGLISNSIWDAWKAGMKSNLEIPFIYCLWIRETRNTESRDSYYGLVSSLGKLTKVHDCDVCK